MIYQILTENKDAQGIEEIVSKQFDSFTIRHGVGYWKGQKENCVIIEIDTFNANQDARVSEVAKSIKKYNQQESVLVQKLESKSILI